MSEYFALRERKAIPVSHLEWAGAFQKKDRRVARTELGDNVVVSTVFLGLNHSLDPDAPPQIFETLIFGGLHDQDMWRCSTWEEAERQHEEACEMVRGGLEGQNGGGI